MEILTQENISNLIPSQSGLGRIPHLMLYLILCFLFSRGMEANEVIKKNTGSCFSSLAIQIQKTEGSLEQIRSQEHSDREQTAKKKEIKKAIFDIQSRLKLVLPASEEEKKQAESLSKLPVDKRADAIYHINAVKIDSYTNFYDNDKTPGAIGKKKLVVYAAPIDETGDHVKAGGTGTGHDEQVVPRLEHLLQQVQRFVVDRHPFGPVRPLDLMAHRLEHILVDITGTRNKESAITIHSCLVPPPSKVLRILCCRL